MPLSAPVTNATGALTDSVLILASFLPVIFRPRAARRAPLIAKMPKAADWLVFVVSVMLTGCPGPMVAARNWQVAAICQVWGRLAA